MTGWHGNPVDGDDNDDTVFRVRDMLPAGILALLGLIGLVLASLSAGPPTRSPAPPAMATPWPNRQVTASSPFARRGNSILPTLRSKQRGRCCYPATMGKKSRRTSAGEIITRSLTGSE